MPATFIINTGNCSHFKMTQQCSWTQPIFLRACSVMTDSAAHGLWPGRLLCPWNFQASILEWVAISSSTRSSRPRDWTHLSWVSSFGRQIVYHRNFVSMFLSFKFMFLSFKFTPLPEGNLWKYPIWLCHPSHPLPLIQGFPLLSTMDPFSYPFLLLQCSLLFLSLIDSILEILFYWNMP